VLVRNPLYVKARRGTTLRGTKTDPVEARLLAEILRREAVPTTLVPEAAVHGRRELTRRRAALVAQISDIKRRVITVLDRVFPAGATCVRGVGLLLAEGYGDTPSGYPVNRGMPEGGGLHYYHLVTTDATHS
jgi:Transposase